MDGIESEFEEQHNLDDNKISSTSDASDNNNSTVDEEKQLINDVEDNDIYDNGDSYLKTNLFEKEVKS
jgi:hypothetical protein